MNLNEAMKIRESLIEKFNKLKIEQDAYLNESNAKLNEIRTEIVELQGFIKYEELRLKEEKNKENKNLNGELDETKVDDTPKFIAR